MPAADHYANEYLNPAQAATYLGFTVRALIEWRRRGVGPRYVRIGGASGRIRYARCELDAYMRERTFRSTSSEAVGAAKA